MPKKRSDSDLTILPPKQAKAVVLLMAGGSVEESAKAIGVNTRTIYAWMDNPQFKNALRQAQADYISGAQNRLISGQQTALNVLLDVMTTADSASVRRAAAVDWLSLLWKYRENCEFEDRLAALERTVNDVK